MILPSFEYAVVESATVPSALHVLGSITTMGSLVSVFCM